MYKPTPKILIAGANGANGRAFLAQLNASGVAARAMVRNKQLANGLQNELTEVVEANLSDINSLKQAFKDIELAYIIAPIHPDAVILFNNFFNAAKQAEVRHIVKLSGYGAASDSKSEILRQHYQSDELLLKSGLNYTIVQPNAFFQNLFVQEKSIRLKGRFTNSVGNARQSLIDIRDVAEAVFNIFYEDNHLNNIYQLTGPEPLNAADIAEQLSSVLNKPVRYRDINADIAEPEMLLAGLPSWNAHAIAEIQDVFSSGEYADISNDAVSILGRTPRSFREFVADYSDEFGMVQNLP